MDVEFGNASKINTSGTGWLVGFGDWFKEVADSLRFMPCEATASTICVKWMDHPKGDSRGAVKPPSMGRTLSILVSESGKFLLEFSPDKTFPDDRTQSCLLHQHGDFVIWGEGVYHRWRVEEKCTVLTFRWVPLLQGE